MGLPSNELASSPIAGNYIEPRTIEKKPLIDLEVGGIGLQDPSAGLQYQTWKAKTDGSNITIEAPNTSPVAIYSGSNITEISLAFDSNMNYAIAFVENGTAKFKWYDATISDFTITNLGTAINPRCTMDDKRAFNNSGRDVILAYLKSGNLYFRQQRERYSVEHLLDGGGGWECLFNTGMNSQLRMQFLLKGSGGASGPCQFPLSETVKEICLRAGIPLERLDTRLLQGIVEGVQITNEQECHEYLNTLSDTFFFDPSNYDGVLHYRHRGSDQIRVINESELIGDYDDERTRKMPQSIPRVINLNYYNVGASNDTDKQTSDRSIDTRGEDEKSFDSPVMMTADFAKQLVVKKHKVIIEEQKGEVELELPNNHLDLTVGDVVIFKDDRLRIVEEKRDLTKQTYKLAYDRRSAYESNAIGLQPTAPISPASLVAGDTRVEIIDSHITSSSDDSRLGFYVAASGKKTAWRGAIVELSEDGGANYTQSQTATGSAIIGDLATVLSAPINPNVPDEQNTLTVQLVTPNAELEAATFAEMMNRKNRALVGNEIINFGNVSEVSPGVWELSALLRGRLGSDAVSHSIGERFVLLDRNYIEYVPTEIYNLGQTLTVRASTIGATNQTTTSQVFNGESQKERAVSNLQAVRDGAGNVDISWLGVGRIGGKGNVSHGQHFTNYQVEINGDTYNTTSQSITAPISASATTIKVYQINSLTGKGKEASIIV